MRADPLCDADNMSDALRKIENLMVLHPNIKIDKLYVYDHGSPGIQWFGDGTDVFWHPDEDIPIDMDERWEERYGRIPYRPVYKIVQHMTEGGQVILMGCGVGEGEDGKVYLENIAKMTGKKTKACKGDVHYGFGTAVCFRGFRNATP